jgi:hypothetical protein
MYKPWVILHCMEFDTMRHDDLALKNSVAEWVKVQGISVRGFARLAGLPEPTLAKMMSENWDPRTSTLDACVRAIRAQGPEKLNEQNPSEIVLPYGVVERPNNNSLRDCAKIWAECDGDTARVLTALNDHALANRVSVVELGENNRLYFTKFGPTTWSTGEMVTGKQVADMPDKSFGDWAEKSLAVDFHQEQPRLLSCTTPIQTDLGAFVVPYTALRLPCDISAGHPKNIITITKLKPSAYRDAREGVNARLTPASAALTRGA